MKKLASYFGVSLSAAYKWSAEAVRRKTVIMESGAEPEIIKLIGEISQLCYIYNCANIKGETAFKVAAFDYNAITGHFKIKQPDGRYIFSLPTFVLSVAELQKVKSTLESFVYGGA